MEDDKYVDFVEEEAKKIGKIFILDSGEGNEFFDEENQFDGEDLSGWLIDEGERENFIEVKNKGNEYEVYGDNYIFAKWNKNSKGKLTIEFVKY